MAVHEPSERFFRCFALWVIPRQPDPFLEQPELRQSTVNDAFQHTHLRLSRGLGLAEDFPPSTAGFSIRSL